MAHVLWVTTHDPQFLPDDVDGHVLFERAVARMKGPPGDTPVGGIGDIVMVPSAREARARGDLGSVRPFTRMTAWGRLGRRLGHGGRCGNLVHRLSSRTRSPLRA
jgi:hypothetical protein